MKKRVMKISVIVFCMFILCSCFSFQNVAVEDMSLIGLNKYRDYLYEENNYLSIENESLSGVSDGKTYEEIIEIINQVNEDVIKSNVMITSQSKSFFTGSSISSGSGTIIKEDELYYYVLTNNHVIYSLGNRVSYYVYDYLNNEYSNARVLFSDPNYDMALLRFNKGISNLRVATLAKEDIEVKDNVIVIGQPQGQRNTVTFGEVISYGKVNCSDCNEDESNVKYDCIFYNARTTNGNSGGMILDYEYNLVGVVTFGMTDSKGEYLYGAGSPISKVLEFLSMNEFEVGDINA